MSMIPGTSEVGPTWRGIIRERGRVVFTCRCQNHTDQKSAHTCASVALAQFRLRGTLPEQWHAYNGRIT